MRSKSGYCLFSILPFVAILLAVVLALCRGHWLEAALFAALAIHLAFMVYASLKANPSAQSDLSERRPKYDLH